MRSPTPLTSCCCGCSLRDGVAIIAWLGLVGGALLVAMARALARLGPMMGEMMDATADERMELCKKEPSNPVCQDQEQALEDMGQLASYASYYLIFVGVLEIVRSAVGIYASWHENLAFARIYMWSWFVSMALGLLTFANALANPMPGSVFCFHLLTLGIMLYYTMVIWSFYQRLKDRRQRPSSDGDVAMRLMHP